MTEIRAVILFDLDGTLLDARGAGQLAMEQTAREEFGISVADCNVPMHGRTDTAIVTDVLVQLGLPPSARAAFLDGYVARLPAALHERSSRLLPGSAAAVEAVVGDSSLEAAVLTGNLEGACDAKLDHHGLLDCFRFRACGDRHASRDDLALDAADKLADEGLPTGRSVWVVGDTTADVRCARAAGFSVATVEVGGSTREELAASRPDLMLKSLEDFGCVLDALDR